jgi:hypothetical protein
MSEPLKPRFWRVEKNALDANIRSLLHAHLLEPIRKHSLALNAAPCRRRGSAFAAARTSAILPTVLSHATAELKADD